MVVVTRNSSTTVFIVRPCAKTACKLCDQSLTKLGWGLNPTGLLSSCIFPPVSTKSINYIERSCLPYSKSTRICSCGYTNKNALFVALVTDFSSHHSVTDCHRHLNGPLKVILHSCAPVCGTSRELNRTILQSRGSTDTKEFGTASWPRGRYHITVIFSRKWHKSDLIGFAVFLNWYCIAS